MTTTSRAVCLNRISMKGDLLPEELLLHKCNNRACVNPDHLRPGIYAENYQDAQNCGNGRGKPDNDMLQLFLLARWGLNFAQIGKTVGQPRNSVRLILVGKRRSYLRKVFEAVLKNEETACQ